RKGLSSHTYSILVGTTVAFLLVFSLFSLLALSTTPMPGIHNHFISSDIFYVVTRRISTYFSAGKYQPS
ncbi:hypothetical protein, partial [Dorea sp. AM58-8]|uniref:hypothetical protein n=1 Tax=Dorea sp. AM58-8 TaxID=2292346 RepID=UPI001A9A4482